jgi:two-component system, OmpR family, sensor kinase
VTRSLSGRLLVGVVSLVLLGLLVADGTTYLTFQKFLLDRLDSQLTNGRVAAVGVLGGPGPGRGAEGQFPIGTIVELLRPDGTEIGLPLRYDFPSSTSKALPVVPAKLPTASETSPAVVTVAGTGGVSEYRVAIWPEDSFQGNYVLLAIPMSDVQESLSQLLLLEALIGLAVLVATALLALIIIRIGLRPLQRMGVVAEDIAAGDLSRRVEPATPDTEIGRLGLALNGMLSQIESAFAERTRSENMLRRFIADASHELRTPLTSVRGYAEMLRRGAEKSPADSALARRRIEEESMRMSVMVDDMLVLARLGQGRPLEHEPVDLQAIARDTVADAHAVAPQREISLDAPRSVLVIGDDTRLRQALGNLVRNALVHTPPDTPIEVGLTSEDGVVRMTVADHGPGLGADDAARIFEPFYRADPSRSRDSGGVGLGLSIVSAVAGAHGGRVTVKETPGGGATFELELPTGAGATEATTPQT